MSKHDKTGIIGELTAITTSKSFYLLIEERKNFLQKEVNKFIRAQDWYNAYATVAKIDDLFKLFELAQQRLKKLQTEKNGS